MSQYIWDRRQREIDQVWSDYRSSVNAIWEQHRVDTARIWADYDVAVAKIDRDTRRAVNCWIAFMIVFPVVLFLVLFALGAFG